MALREEIARSCDTCRLASSLRHAGPRPLAGEPRADPEGLDLGVGEHRLVVTAWPVTNLESPAVKRTNKSRSPGAKSPRVGTLTGWLTFLLISATVGTTSAAILGYFFSTREFHRHGILIDADTTTRVLTVQKVGSGGRNTYTWSERTGITSGDVKAGPEVLSPGAEVIVYYRGSFAVSPMADRIRVTGRPPRR